MAATSRQMITKSLGPGLLMAAAAIGVSHLVQSTRAGADYGFALVWAVLLANIFKYPFLEFGPRYALAANESLIDGYKKLGSFAIAFFLMFTIGTMFAVQAAVTVVTASLAAEMTGIVLSPVLWSAILLFLCIIILITDKYSVLDNVVKILMSVLALSTLVAVGAALFQAEYTTIQSAISPELWTVTGVAFLIALMGWMPIPIDASAWHSLWSLEKNKQDGHITEFRGSLIDFNVGYIGAAILALLFLTLGALIMFGSGIDFASSGAAFSSQLIQLYTVTLGNWAYPIIIICAFTTMFSTTLIVTDAYPRVCRRFVQIYRPGFLAGSDKFHYRFFLILISAISLTFLHLLGDQFRFLIDLATTLSFLGAPVLAYINYKLMHPNFIPKNYIPRPWLIWLSRAGLLFLTGFALLYIYWVILF
ncbi:MAG: NRAMP family divalent metal transporter [Balneolaceae bacterium]